MQPTSLAQTISPRHSGLRTKLSHDSKAVQIKVSLLDEHFMYFSTPEILAQFSLNLSQRAPPEWGLAAYASIAPSLFAKKKAGLVEITLEIHGGSDFATCIGKERIDFAQNDATASCFVGEGDFRPQNYRWGKPQPKEKIQRDIIF